MPQRPRPAIPPPLACAVVLATLIALWGPSARTVPPGATADDRTADRIVGVVEGSVITTPRGHGALLRLDQTAVWIWSRAPIASGQEIAATGRLRAPRGFLAPGSPDRAIVAASRGAEWELDAAHIEVLRDDPTWRARIWRWAARTQQIMARRIMGGAPPPDPAPGANAQSSPARAALSGIVTGDRSHIPRALDERWRVVGIYHVLSVSGLHLAVIAGLAFALLRRLVAASPWGGRTRPARWAGPIAIVLAIAYTLVTGAQLATLRALLVVTLVLVGQMLDRPIRLVDALGVAAIVILVWRPQDLHDPSFQLSFVAALTLALRPRRDLRVLSRRARVLQWIRDGLATSAWVALTTAPLTALHFHQVAAGGVVGNLVLTPVVELLALPLGLGGTLLGDLGTPLIEVAVWLVAAVDDIAGVLVHVMPVGKIALASPLLMTVLVACSLWLAARPRHARGRLAAWLVVCAVWSGGRAAVSSDALRVTFLDVGQGDAAIVELPGGEVWLVDAGGIASARDVAAASAPGAAIARTLAVYGHTAIDVAIISHPHPDHYLGLAGLGVPVGELWFVDEPVGPTDDTTGAYRGHREPGPDTFTAIAYGLAARGTRLVRPGLGTIPRGDGVEVEVLAPRFQAIADGPEIFGADPVRSVNDNSLVVAFRYAGRTILFAGDLEAEGEAALVAAGLGPVDIVKVAHHGSLTSSAEELVTATRPAIAVISCGVANAFGFPANEVLTRWQAAGARVLRTDRDGSITVTIGTAGDLVVERFVDR